MTVGTFSRLSLSAAVFVLCVNSVRCDEIRRPTLSETLHLAVKQNGIARFKVNENEKRRAGTRSDYFPTITNHSNALHISELQNIAIPPGSLGSAAGASISPQCIVVSLGKQTLLSSGTMIAQPLTLLLRIHPKNRAAAVEGATWQGRLKQAEDEIALEVHALYFGSLVALLQKKAPLAQPPLIGRAYVPERNVLFAIVILPVQRRTNSTRVSKHQRPKTLGVNDELSARFRYTG